jgi:hypothetical protein
MAPRRKDLAGKIFGRWRVQHLSHYNPHGEAYWVCICACGTVRTVRGSMLNSGDTQSCGCYRSECIRNRQTKHEMCFTAEYRAWSSMLSRCSDSNVPCWVSYGGRGITVCEEWKSFENFYRDMGPKPSKDHSLDRIDNNGPYCKENCRWATRKEQQNNLRSNRLVEFNNETLTAAQWAAKIGIAYHVLLGRLRAGWPVERALTQPVRGKQ